MGNQCCSEGGQNTDTEYIAYGSQQRPVNQSNEELNLSKQSAKKFRNQTNLGNNMSFAEKQAAEETLLAYTSTDRNKIVKIQSHYRGHSTRTRLNDGNEVTDQQMKQYKSGNLMNVHNQNIDQGSEESAIYSGQMLKDSPNIKQGYGIMRWPDGTVYEGLWDNNLYNGRGKLYHASGDLYEGEFVNDMAQGFGIYKHANGSKYVGYWNQDKQHGFGKEKWNDFSQYQGFYQNASKEGQGEYCWPDGNRYVGEWSNNMLNGKGLFMWHDDRLFLGDWKDNMMHGQGTYKWNDGRMFVGDYENDRKSGMGIYLWADGRAYYGEWDQGKQHGQGYYVTPDKESADGLKIKKGVWNLGKRQNWVEDISEKEVAQQKTNYAMIKQRQTSVDNDIQAIENTMKSLVLQQLGDKSSYDSTLGGLDTGINGPDGNTFGGPPATKNLTGPNASGEKPLENLIREALAYDSVSYKQALGIDGSLQKNQPNGVLKSQEFERLRSSTINK